MIEDFKSFEDTRKYFEVTNDYMQNSVKEGPKVPKLMDIEQDD